MRIRRVWNLVFTSVVLAVGSFGGSYLYRNYQELEVMRQREQAAMGDLEELQSKISERTEILRKLEGDPEYVERVIRAKFNYAKKDEVIFRFE